jgi:hypothetical protein
MYLVDTLEGRHALALVLVEGLVLDTAVAQVDLTVRLLLPGESVLHPVLIITLGVVLTGVSTTRLLAVGRGDSGLSTRGYFVSI